MKAEKKIMNTMEELISADFEAAAPEESKVFVRLDSGEFMEGLEAFRDGISFISPRSLPGGKKVELIICDSIMVDAVVVACVMMPEGYGNYLVRARFHNTSVTLNNLIYEELNELLHPKT